MNVYGYYEKNNDLEAINILAETIEQGADYLRTKLRNGLYKIEVDTIENSYFVGTQKLFYN
jgi:hypothetical protein